MSEVSGDQAPPAPEGRPWDRRRGESSCAHRAFKAYLALGDDRSLVKLSVQMRQSRQSVTVWSAKHDWNDRAIAYDNHLTAVEMARREAVRAENAERWERRRAQQAESSWDIACRLHARALEMLEVSIHGKSEEIRDEDGRVIQINYEPAKWDLKTAALFAKTAADLAQLALFNAQADADDFDPTQATPDELRAYLMRRGVKSIPSPTGD